MVTERTKSKTTHTQNTQPNRTKKEMVKGIVKHVECKPYDDQVMGTSGLRKKVTVVQQPHYIATFVSAIFDVLLEDKAPESAGCLVVAGDGRYYNREAIEVVLGEAAARRVAKVVVPLRGMASTPAVSRMIRNRNLVRGEKVLAGFILTASHNPAGPQADFGFKVNMPNGGPALKELTDAVYERSKAVSGYDVAVWEDGGAVDLDALGTQTVAVRAADGGAAWEMAVEVIDPVDEYVAMCRENFDLPLIRAFLAESKLRVLVDSLNAVTGLYTRRIFCEELGLDAAVCRNNVPLADFGGLHADPNLVYAKALVDLMYTGAYDFGCAFDGDGDRNMILGNRFFVTPSDSLAVLTANHHKIRYFREHGFHGVARSMPTSAAVDRVARDQRLPLFETPTGWKFFGNVMDAGTLSLCGEESFGTGSDLIREKDGIWAALAWLSVLAETNRGRDLARDGVLGVRDIVEAHWRKYGRNYYSRYDYEGVDSDRANALMAALRERLPALKEQHGLATADDFEYRDPVDKSVTTHQGIRLIYPDGTRAIFRLSGTGSVGATIRVYFDKYESDPAKLNLDTAVALKDLIATALSWARIKEFTGRSEPTVIT